MHALVEGASPHKPLLLQVRSNFIPRRPPKRKPVGWKVSGEQAVFSNDCVRRGISSSPDSLEHFNDTVASEALQRDFVCRGSQPKVGIIAHPELRSEIKRLEQQRRLCYDAPARLLLTRDICKLRRKLIRKRAAAKAKVFADKRATRQWSRTPGCPLLEALNGVEDHTAWPQELTSTSHFSKIFSKMDQKRDIWKRQATTKVADHSFSTVVTFDMLDSALAGMTKGKTCADDNLVLEMFIALGADNRSHLCELFTKRITGKVGAPMNWDGLLSVCIPKVAKPKLSATSQLRPICIIPVLKKVYLRIL